MSDAIRVLVVGCGHMGTSHARAYRNLDEFEVAGVVSRGPESRGRLSAELGGVPQFGSYEEALAEAKPDAVCISTYPDTHARYALMAIEAGAHVFLEKPIAETIEDAEYVVRSAKERGRKVVVGYILRHHPGWMRFTEVAQTLGKPLVMRMNLNQQSSGDQWRIHRNLMEAMSPIVDCGVHYVDVMCQMTGSRPVQVQAIGARLSDEIAPDMYNYGQLQVIFEDGSVGWYEAGWGPMMSEVAYFVKDVIGPKGCVSLVKKEGGDSADIEAHTKADVLRLHRADLDGNGRFAQPDEIIRTEDEPDHDGLCEREQQYFLRAIQEDLDLTQHLDDVVNSLRIVLAADESVRSGAVVRLE
jgi:predicted dehydrogenase